MPARHCDPNIPPEQAPDGTWWQVDCPEGPPRTVCQWKVDQEQEQQGAAYKKLEGSEGFAAGGGPGPAAGRGPAAGGAGAGDGGVIHLGVGKQEVVDQDQYQDQDEDMGDADSFADVPPAVPPVAIRQTVVQPFSLDEHMNDGEMHPLSVMDRVKAPGTIKVLVLCHPRPFAGHWQENLIRQHTEELFADRLKTGETLDFFTLDPIVSTHNTADFSMGNAPNLFSVTLRYRRVIGGLELKAPSADVAHVTLTLTRLLSIRDRAAIKHQHWSRIILDKPQQEGPHAHHPGQRQGHQERQGHQALKTGTDHAIAAASRATPTCRKAGFVQGKKIICISHGARYIILLDHFTGQMLWYISV